MDLLQDLVKNFRYTCVTTTKNEIYIYLYSAEGNTISKDSVTDIENGYLNYRTDVIENKTLSKTENENEVRLNNMNTDIESYIRDATGEITKITVINASKSHKFILEPKVFKAMTDRCGILWFDMGTISGFRLSSYNYNQIEELHIEESVILLDKSAVLYLSTFYQKWGQWTAYNKVDDPLALNISANKKIKIMSLEQYGPVKSVFGCSTKTGEEFQDAKLEVNYLKIFGSEIIAKDKTDERILVKGFNKVYFDNIDIEDQVTYSTIVNVDRVSNFNIGKLTRNIGEIIPNPMIKINRVGKVNLRQFTINNLPNSTINENDFAIVSFLPADDEFERSINLNNVVINNDSDKKLKIIKLKKLSLNKIYISRCTIGDNVDLLNLDESSNVVKLTFNNSSFTTNSDFNVFGSTKLTLTDTTITTSKNIILKSPYVNITGGLWDCYKLDCDYDNYMKIVMERLELHSNYFAIKNGESDMPQTAFINNCKLDVLKSFSIKNMRPSMINTYIKSEEFRSECDETAQFNNVLLGYQKNNKIDLLFKSNISGSVTVDDVDDGKLNINLHINDTKNENVNNLDIYLQNEKTNLTYKINRPLNSIVNNLGSQKPIRFSAYDDILSGIDSYIKLAPNDDAKILGKVINDSELIVSYTKSTNNENQEVYQFTKIKEDEE